MSREGVRVLLALYSRLRPPPSDEEAEELLEFFQREEDEIWQNGYDVGREQSRHIIYLPVWPIK